MTAQPDSPRTEHDVPLPLDAPSSGWDVPVDRATGEVLTGTVLLPGEVAPPPRPMVAVPTDDLPLRLGTDGALAAELYRSPDLVRTLCRDAKEVLLQRLRTMAERGRQARAAGPPTPTVLAPELQTLADAHDVLAAIGGTFSEVAREAKAMAGEVAHELADDPRRGTTSVKVGAGKAAGGVGTVKVTRTQPTEVSVDVDDLVDLLGTIAIGLAANEATTGETPATDAAWAKGAAAGARAAITLYRSVAAAHTFQTTKLDALGRDLENAEQDALAIRLGHAYGRVPRGKPQVKIERDDG